MTSENSTIDFHVTIYYHIKVVMPKVEKKNNHYFNVCTIVNPFFRKETWLLHQMKPRTTSLICRYACLIISTVLYKRQSAAMYQLIVQYGSDHCYCASAGWKWSIKGE